jgi:hypothetical protein
MMDSTLGKYLHRALWDIDTDNVVARSLPHSIPAKLGKVSGA